MEGQSETRKNISDSYRQMFLIFHENYLDFIVLEENIGFEIVDGLIDDV